MSNVLIPCGGRWVGLIVQMKQAMRDVEALRHGRLLVADRDASNPAGFFADENCVVPAVSDPLYVDRLLEACRRQAVRVVVPHLDLDLDSLVPHVERFAEIGVTVACPRPDLVELCRDKRRFEAFAAHEGLPCPRSYSREELRPERFPLFAKRSRGSASEGAGVCRSLAEANGLLARWPDLIFQELCEGVFHFRRNF
jgi:carbamoyl-phosphate synthase large subunit